MVLAQLEHCGCTKSCRRGKLKSWCKLKNMWGTAKKIEIYPGWLVDSDFVPDPSEYLWATLGEELLKFSCFQSYLCHLFMLNNIWRLWCLLTMFQGFEISNLADWFPSPCVRSILVNRSLRHARIVCMWFADACSWRYGSLLSPCVGLSIKLHWPHGWRHWGCYGLRMF